MKTLAHSLLRFFQLAFSGILTLLAISLMTFLLMKAVPGGPFDGDKALSPEILQALNAKFRLDLPWYQQFYFYLRDIFVSFDFGPSIKYVGRSVTEIIGEALPVSLELGSYALLIAIFLGVGLGVLAAAFRGTWIDFSAMLVAISGVSLPSFLVAALAILFFSQTLGVLPAGLWDGPEHRILPSFVLGIRPAAIIARMTRSSILEILYLDFVRTARAKGISEQKVLFVHVLKNALIPILTIMGPMAAAVLTGSFVIEYVFSVPGIANNFIQAVGNRDYPLIMGVTLLFATVLVSMNLLVDFLYAIVDPRMRAQEK
jgi:oligopeptide transport system permease protein